MEIDKIVLNGVEYILTDAQAKAILSILQNEVLSIKEEQDIMDNRIDAIEDNLKWNVCD